MQCPFCKEEIIDGAIKCKHCGSILVRAQKATASLSNRCKYLKWWQAILITIGVLIGMIVGVPVVGSYFPFLVVGATAIWATVETSRLRLGKYKSGVNPFFMFIGSCLLWIVVFPLFLVMQSKVKNGVAELK